MTDETVTEAAEDEGKVAKMEDAVVEQAGTIDTELEHAVGGIENEVEHVDSVTESLLENAFVDPLKKAVDNGIRAFDGYAEHAVKVTFFREVADVGAKLSVESREILAKLLGFVE
jgi:hypothetical protein